VKTQFVNDIQERDLVESTFLVKDKVTAMAKNGKPYMTIRLMDRSGELEGRIWDRVDELEDRFRKDDFLWVRGRASRYLGKMQLVVQELKPLPEKEVNLADYLPTAPRDREEFRARDSREIGWGLAEVMALSDRMIVNDRSLYLFREDAKRLLRRMSWP